MKYGAFLVGNDLGKWLDGQLQALPHVWAKAARIACCPDQEVFGALKQ